MSTLTPYRTVEEAAADPRLDEALAEVGRFIEARGLGDLIGMTLVHGHFPLGQGEHLVETVDPRARTLTIQPMVGEQDTIPTQWGVVDGEPVVALGCLKIGPLHHPDESKG